MTPRLDIGRNFLGRDSNLSGVSAISYGSGSDSPSSSLWGSPRSEASSPRLRPQASSYSGFLGLYPIAEDENVGVTSRGEAVYKDTNGNYILIDGEKQYDFAGGKKSKPKSTRRNKKTKLRKTYKKKVIKVKKTTYRKRLMKRTKKNKTRKYRHK
jgi:hypothetical protein